jgi:hypothetical protein
MSEKPMLEKFAFFGSSAWRVVEREGSLQPRRPHRHFKFAEQTAAATSWYRTTLPGDAILLVLFIPCGCSILFRGALGSRHLL